MSRSDEHRTLVLVTGGTVVALVAFVVPQATVIRTVADLGGGSAAVAWLLAAMPLGLAVALLPAGAAGDGHGRRRVFATGLALLGVGAGVCAAAGGPVAFVLGRLAQGVGAGAVLACGLGLIAHVFSPGPGRARATGVWGASIGGGIATGGLLPVVVDPGDGWRVSYLVLAVAAVALAVAARVLLTESASEQRRVPDVLGAVLLGAGLGCLLAALVRVRGPGGAGAEVGVLLAAGLVLVGAFAAVEARVAAPMLDLGLFARRDFLAATTGAVANGAGGTALVSYLPTVVQAGLGRSLLAASLLTLLFAGTSVLTALQVRRLPARVPTWSLMTVSLLGVGAGQLALAGLTPGSGVGRLVPGLAVGGVAYGVLNAALGRAAVASVPAGRASVGSGANNTARYLASALGITLVALLAPHDPTAGPAGTAALVQGWNTAALVTAAISLAGALVIAALRPRAPR